MADQVLLKAESGRELGSSSSRRLRRSGRIPAVVYGLGAEPLPVSVDYSDARVALGGDAGINALLNLEIDDSVELCVVKALQHHVVRDEVTHIDFFRVDPNAEIEVEVPLTLVGDPRLVTQVSGMVDQELFSVALLTKPTAIPNDIEVDVSEMEVGDTIRVEDLVLPEGTSAASDGDATVCSAMVTRSTLEAMRQAEADEEAEGAGTPSDSPTPSATAEN